MYRLDDVCATRLQLILNVDSLKIYRGKDCVEKIIEHIEDCMRFKRLYAIFLQQTMTKLTVLMC